MATTSYKGYNFTDEDLLLFDKYGMDVQNAVDQGFSEDEILSAAKEIEQDELFKQERAMHPVQQSRPVAPPPSEVPPDTDFWQSNTTAGDLAKTFGSTLSNLLGSTVGWGLERWGESIGNETLFETGKYIKDRANEVSEDLNTSMTTGGRSDSIGSRDLLKFDKPDDIIPSGLGDANIGTVLQLLAGGTASTLPILGIGGKVAKGLSKVPGVSPTVAGGVGYGLTGGAIEGLATASDVYNDAMKVTDAEIVNSPIFSQITKIVQAQYPDAQGSQLLDFTRKQIARQAAWEAGAGSGALIAATSWPIGGFLGRLGLAEKGTENIYRKGMASTIYGGAWREGAQEFFQEGGQQIAQNYGKYLTGQNPDAINFEGFTEAGARGLVPGTVLGGTTAGVQNVTLPEEPDPTPDPDSIDDPPDPSSPGPEEEIRLDEEEDLIGDPQPTPQDPESPAQRMPVPKDVPPDDDPPAPASAPVVVPPKPVEEEVEGELDLMDKIMAEDDIEVSDDDTKTDVQLGLPLEDVPPDDDPPAPSPASVPVEEEQVVEEDQSVVPEDVIEKIETAKVVELGKIAQDYGVTKEEVEEIRLGDPKKYRDKETGSVLEGKRKALKSLIYEKLNVDKGKVPQKEEEQVVHPEEDLVPEEDDPTIPPVVDIDEDEIGKPVIAKAPAPVEVPEETVEEEPEEVSQDMIDAIVLVDTYGEKPEDLRDQKEKNVGEMRSLAKKLGIKVKSNETKFNTAKKIINHVKKNRPDSEIRKESLQGRLEIGKARSDIVAKTTDVDTKIAEAIARAGDSDVPVSLELRTKIQRRIRELERKEKAGTITDQERKNLEVHKNSRDFYEKRVSREFANNPEGLKKELKKLKKAAKKKLENLWTTHRPTTGLVELLADPKTRDTAVEWLEVEMMSAKLSKSLTDTGDVTIQKITPDSIAMQELEAAYVARDKALSDLNKRRNTKALELENELKAFRAGQYNKVKQKKISKEKANKEIKVKESNLALAMKNYINKEILPKIAPIEEKFYKLAEKYEFDPKGFKPEIIEDATIEDLEEATDIVKEQKRQFTETMNALYHSDGTYVGPTGGFIKSGNKNLLPDDESRAVEQIMADEGFSIGDEYTSAELLELRDRMKEEDPAPTDTVSKPKSPMRKSREEDPSLMESYPAGTGLQGWRVRALQDWADSLQGKKRKAGKKSKVKVRYKPKMYESPFKKTTGIGSRDRNGRLDTGLELVEKGSIEEAKQAVFKRTVQSTGNPIKLTVQEENNVMNIEILADDGSLDGAWIGALTLELLPTKKKGKKKYESVKSEFSSSQMLKHGITLKDVDMITAHTLGATVFSTKDNAIPGSYFDRHQVARNMLNPKQQAYFDDIGHVKFTHTELEISEEEETQLLEQIKKPARRKPKPREEYVPVDVALGDIFRDKTAEELPVDRGEVGEEVSPEEKEAAVSTAKERKKAKEQQKEIDAWNKKEGVLSKERAEVEEKIKKAKEEGDEEALGDYESEMALIDNLMGEDFDETASEGNPPSKLKDVVDDSNESVADEKLNCNVKLGNI